VHDKAKHACHASRFGPYVCRFNATRGRCTRDESPAGLCGSDSHLRVWDSGKVPGTRSAMPSLRIDPVPSVAFIHIPKTGGSVIESTARRQANISWGLRYHTTHAIDTPLFVKGVGPRVCDELDSFNAHSHHLSKRVNARHCCSWWHTPPSFLLPMDPRPYFFAPWRFCVLREPILRLISQFKHERYNDCLNDDKWWKATGDSDGNLPTDVVERHLLAMRQCSSYAHQLSCSTRFLQWVQHAAGTVRSRPYAQDCHLLPQSAFVEARPTRALDPRLNSEGPRAFSEGHGRSWDSEEPRAFTNANASAPAGACNLVLKFERLHEEFDWLVRWARLRPSSRTGSASVGSTTPPIALPPRPKQIEHPTCTEAHARSLLMKNGSSRAAAWALAGKDYEALGPMMGWAFE